MDTDETNCVPREAGENCRRKRTQGTQRTQGRDANFRNCCECDPYCGAVTSTTRKPRSVSVRGGNAEKRSRAADREDCSELSKAPPRTTFRPLALEAGACRIGLKSLVRQRSSDFLQQHFGRERLLNEPVGYCLRKPHVSLAEAAGHQDSQSGMNREALMHKLVNGHRKAAVVRDQE